MSIQTGNLLRKMRMMQGLTQFEIGEKLNFNTSTVSRIENGEISIKTDDFFEWVKTTQGQDMLITFMLSADIITSVPTVLNTILTLF